MSRVQRFTKLPVCLLLVLLGMFTSGAAAQEKNELSVLLGRTFIRDQGVKDVPPSDSILHFGNRLTYQLNYGRRLLDVGIAKLTLEVPVVANFNQDARIPVNLIPKSYGAFFITPSIRANLFPSALFSPWVSVGGGVGRASMRARPLNLAGANPRSDRHDDRRVPGRHWTRSQNLEEFQPARRSEGFLFRSTAITNVDTGRSRQHNYFVGAGVVWHF